MDDLFEDLINKLESLQAARLSVFSRDEKTKTAKVEVKKALNEYIDQRIKKYFEDDGK